MKNILKILSAIGLILTVLPAFLVFAGTITLDDHKSLMLIGTFAWFLSAPFWMNKEKSV